MKKYILLMATLLILSACMQNNPYVVAEHAFQNAMLYGNNTKNTAARKDFSKSYENYKIYITEKKSKNEFESTIAKFTMSAYYAGDYQKCIEIAQNTKNIKNAPFEIPLYAGLAASAMNDSQEATRWWKNFTETSQAHVYKTLKEQSNLLEKKETSTKNVTTIVENAIAEQLRLNKSFRKNNQNALEECDGPYWWRYNISPCVLPRKMLTNSF